MTKCGILKLFSFLFSFFAKTKIMRFFALSAVVVSVLSVFAEAAITRYTKYQDKFITFTKLKKIELLSKKW